MTLMSKHSYSTVSFFTSEANAFASLYEKKACFRDRRQLFVNAVSSVATPPAKVLDFGCGPGIIATALAQSGYDVLGVDIASGMIGTARANADALRLTGIAFRDWSKADNDLPNNAFDVVVCSSVIEYVEDDVTVLRLLVAALKPRGHLVISVPNRNSFTGKLEDWRHKVSRKYLAKVRSPQLEYSFRRYDTNDLLVQLAALGFESFRCRSFEFPFFGRIGILVSRLPWVGIMTLISARKGAGPAQMVLAGG